jgi:lipid II:glycine glycyltransferase (peptidoglycan interpeptide bridge formation enzyme)
MLAPDAEWDAFVAGHPTGHILQTSGWAALKGSFGWTSQRAVLRTIPSPQAPIVGGASILFRRLPWGQSLAYVPRGPVVDWGDPAQARAALTMAAECARKQHAALLKIEPELPASPELEGWLASLGFRPSAQRIQPLSTIHVDLAAGEDAILAAMKPKWRYNVRLAERKGVTVCEGTLADLPAIQALMDATGQRDGFAVHSAEYYRLATELFAVPMASSRQLETPNVRGLEATSRSAVNGRRSVRMTWLLAEHEGALLAAIAVFTLGRMAWYLWGASSDEGRNLMPNHALQWAAMRWARARGCEIYDLWGIPDEVGANPAAYAEPESWGEGGLWGVYRFKQGFGGRVIRYTGAWDMPLSGIGYRLYRLALRVRELESG